ncbi:hypothetical protein ACLB9X_18015 [Streptomyces sp. 5K101]|uniref:hypothetical protein n=1 Tax=Streptomyces sp. 5K101 TaxID=3390037 RepID=UPI0039760217
MDGTRADVDAVHGEPQGPPPGPLTAGFLALFVHDEVEVGADEGAVFAGGTRLRRAGVPEREHGWAERGVLA